MFVNCSFSSLPIISLSQCDFIMPNLSSCTSEHVEIKCLGTTGTRAWAERPNHSTTDLYQGSEIFSSIKNTVRYLHVLFVGIRQTQTSCDVY
jgi:hypothetical protein